MAIFALIVVAITEVTIMTNDEKIRPLAYISEWYGEDGRDRVHRRVYYKCPSCNKFIEEDAVACADCRIFFDWSKKAKIVQKVELEWR